MALSPGTRLGPYEIVAPLGAGGMGEVYRARDRALNRDVALKVLPAAFSQDADRLARFKREAHVLASLNHQHIAAIYGFEESGSTQCLVLELVDGETLARRIEGLQAKGSRLSASSTSLGQTGLPVDDAVRIARQVADALEAAHEKGIIHRDLKPANIAIDANDQVKVLDFGLAKFHAGATGGAGAGDYDLAVSPTITTPTGVGTLIGTAAYMAPEQAKGREADKRSDLWAFGCVLYEMLTGKQAFEGEDVVDLLTAVMRSEPDWSALPADTPANVRTVLERCLKKDRRQRIADVAVVQFLLNASSALAPGDASIHAPVVSPPTWRRAIVPVVAAIAGALVGAVLWNFRTATVLPPSVTRFALALGDGEQFTGGSGRQVAISRDGTHVVYVANSHLYLRSMSEPASKVVPGTNLLGGAWNPVFSPDGQSIAFGTPYDNTLKRVAVTGGAPVTIATELGYGAGRSWGSDGIVVVVDDPQAV